MKHWIALAALLSLNACKTAPSDLSSEDRAKVVEEVNELFTNYFEKVRQNGLKAEFEFLDHSPDFFWVPPGYKHAITYDSVAAVLNSNAPKFAAIDNRFDALRVIPLRRDLATYSGKVRSVMTDTSGMVTSVQLIETGVLIKRKDGWKLLSGQTSLIE